MRPGKSKIEFVILKAFLSRLVEPLIKNTGGHLQKAEKTIIFQPTLGETSPPILYLLDHNICHCS